MKLKSSIRDLHNPEEGGSRSAAGESAAPIDVSIVVPVFNERENLDPLLQALERVMESLGCSYEIIFIDDGSSDGSTQLLRQIAAGRPRVRVLEFVRNFGQTASLAAGFDHARGKFIVPLDADLQNDPEDIPQILETLDAGFDVVSCRRVDRKDRILTKKLPSWLANRLISVITGVRLNDYGCTLKGYRREILDHIELYGEMHRFIPIYATWAGARVTEIPVRHHRRHRGRSNYGLSRTFKVLLDLITVKFLGSYSTKPMYLFGGLGFTSFAMGAALSAATLYQKFFYAVKAHRNPLLLLSIFCFIVGVQFILIGLVAELIIRTYHESQNKPTYLLRQSPDRRQVER